MKWLCFNLWAHLRVSVVCWSWNSVALIEATLEELPVRADLGQSCLAIKISAPGPSSFGWFRHRVDGFISDLRTVNNSPTLSLCSSSSKAERTKVKHEFQRYEVSIRDIPNYTLHLWTLKCLSVPSWVVLGSWGMEWSRIKSLPLLMSSSLGFFNKFQNKPCLAPHLILSYRSMCICPYQGIWLAFSSFYF